MCDHGVCDLGSLGPVGYPQNVACEHTQYGRDCVLGVLFVPACVIVNIGRQGHIGPRSTLEPI